jgi:hypothetical protein
VFAPGRPIQPSSTLVSKARTYPSEAPTPDFTYKHNASLGRLAKVKQSSLFGTLVNYKDFFITMALGANVIKIVSFVTYKWSK